MTDHPSKSGNASVSHPELAGDILRGAAAIAVFLFGDPGMRRVVYNFIAKSRFPHFKIGNQIYARKSVVIEWIKDQESRGFHFDNLSTDRG